MTGAADAALHARCRWGLALAALALYTWTCCPTVHWGDSGELIAAGVVLGIAHPPGHPLYSILGHLFSWLPLGAPAWRVNWMSAVFGAAAVVLAFELATDTLRHLGAPRRRAVACGAAAAAMFGLTSGLWSGSTVAETTTLHAALLAGLFWLVWRIAWVQPTGPALTQALGAAAALYGFGATNHVAGIFFLPALAVLLLGRCGREVLRPRNVGTMFACVAAGLSLYAFLPLRSLQDPVLDWANPETLPNFWWVISAKQYQAFMATAQPGTAATAQALGDRGILIAREWTWLGAIGIVVGLLQLARRAPLFATFILLGIVPLVALGLSSAFILAYFVPGLLLLAVALAVGFDRALGLAPRLPRPAFVAAAAALLAWSGVIHYPASALQHDRTAEAYGKGILDQLPPDAVLFSTHQGMLFTTWCLQMVDGYRTDVAVVDPLWLVGYVPLVGQMQQAHPDLRTLTFDEVHEYRKQWGGETLSKDLALGAILAANLGRRPLYVGVLEEPTEVRAHFAVHGPVFEMRAAPGPYVGPETMAATQAYWQGWETRLAQTPALQTDGLRGILVHELNNQGLFFESLDRPDLAAWNYEIAMRLAPAKAEPHLNRGRLYANADAWPEAEAAYRTAATLEPHNARALYHLGTALEAAGELEAAYQAYRTALTWDPHDGDARRRAGLLLLRSGSLERAADYLAWALESDPRDAVAARGLVRVALARGDMAATAHALQRAQDIDAGSVHLLLLMAEYGVRTGQPQAAETLAEAFRADAAVAARSTADAAWARDLLPPRRES